MFFSEKKSNSGATADINQNRQLCQIWGGVSLVVTGGMRIWCYNDGGWRKWGTVEKGELSDSEAVYKVREMGGSRMIIGEILCLFSYIAFAFSLLPLVWWIHL